MSRTSSPARKARVAGQDPCSGLGKVGPAWRVGGKDYLPYRITLLAKLLDRCTNRLLQANTGLSVAEWRVLAQLAISSPASVRQLAEQAWVDRAEVSRAAASLERRELVERRENQKDRRSPLLYCSEKGLALARRVSPSRHEFHRGLTELLTEEQARQFEAAMLILAKHCVDELETDIPPEPRRVK